MKRLWIVAGVGAALLIMTGLAACGPSGSPGTSPTSPAAICPPLGVYTKATVPAPAGNISSVEVFPNTYGKDGTGAAWCSPTQLSAKVVSLASLPPCPVTKGCLAAVDVGPDALNFSSTGTTTNQPKLIFDLTGMTIVPKDFCSGYTCYEIYQLNKSVTPNKWVPVGPAKSDPQGSTNAASGYVKHFTIFAVAELPPAMPLPGPGTLSLVVASEFITSPDDAFMDAALQVRTSDSPWAVPGTERLFRFMGVDLKENAPAITGQAPGGCAGVQPFAAQLTCLFPIDMPVGVTIDVIPNGVSFTMTSVDGQYSVNWHSQQLLIY